MEIGKRILHKEIHQLVKRGLSVENKFLPEWMLMDENGLEFFQEISQLPEYYPASCEKELIALYSKAIAHNFKQVSRDWNIVYWADHPSKNCLTLLREFTHAGISVSLFLLGDSQTNIDQTTRLIEGLPLINVKSANSELGEVLSSVATNAHPTLYLLGPNAESFEVNDLVLQLKAISSRLSRKDRVILNFDLMKSPAVIEKAYHDYKGVNTMLHKNVLERMNREMNANFDRRQFEYWPIYDAVTGACRRYVVSLAEQVVKFPNHHFEVWFKPWETISIGLSQKYDEEMISEVLLMGGLEIEKKLYDPRKYYAMVISKSV
jgi:L-histidine Nalpha-methyltransferase